MKRKILIMGLPGSGKTTLAKQLAPLFNAVLLNADAVRKEANDWDFSPEGRDRQALRMWTLAQEVLDEGKTVVADFVCPTVKTRKETEIQKDDKATVQSKKGRIPNSIFHLWNEARHVTTGAITRCYH